MTVPSDSTAALRTQVLELPVTAEPDAALQGLDTLAMRVEALPLGRDRTALEALVSGRRAEALASKGRLQEALEHGLVADELAASSGDVEAQARAVMACGQVFHEVGHFQEARRRLARLTELEGLAPAVRVQGQMNAAASLRAEGRLGDAADAFAAILPLRRDLPDDLRCSLLINAASCFHQLGRVERAEQAMEEARTLLPVQGRPDLDVWADAIDAWVASRARQSERALDRARSALDPTRRGTGAQVRSSAARAIADVAMWDGGQALRAEAVEVQLLILDELQRARPSSREILQLHRSLASLYEAEGDLLRAVQSLRAAEELDQQQRRLADRLRLEQESMRLELLRMQVEADALRLHQGDLARANRALMAAETARGRLLATLAHDLRSPLTSIKALVDFVEPDDPEDVRRALAVIHSSVDRMVGMLDSALRPLDEGPDDPVDLVEVTQSSVGGFVQLAERKHQRIEVRGEAPVLVRGDPVSLGRLVDNLVSNALKYGPAGGVVGVELSGDGGRASLQVTDEGPGFPGIDPAEGLLFGHQLSTRATGEEASFGLGLHAVYQLLAELGGILAIGNRATGGAVVRVTLPLA